MSSQYPRGPMTPELLVAIVTELGEGKPFVVNRKEIEPYCRAKGIDFGEAGTPKNDIFWRAETQEALTTGLLAKFKKGSHRSAPVALQLKSRAPRTPPPPWRRLTFDSDTEGLGLGRLVGGTATGWPLGCRLEPPDLSALFHTAFPHRGNGRPTSDVHRSDPASFRLPCPTGVAEPPLAGAA